MGSFFSGAILMGRRQNVWINLYLQYLHSCVSTFGHVTASSLVQQTSSEQHPLLSLPLGDNALSNQLNAALSVSLSVVWLSCLLLPFRERKALFLLMPNAIFRRGDIRRALGPRRRAEGKGGRERRRDEKKERLQLLWMGGD